MVKVKSFCHKFNTFKYQIKLFVCVYVWSLSGGLMKLLFLIKNKNESDFVAEKNVLKCKKISIEANV